MPYIFCFKTLRPPPVPAISNALFSTTDDMQINKMSASAALVAELIAHSHSRRQPSYCIGKLVKITAKVQPVISQ